MKHLIYAIRDCVADDSGPLICAPNDGVALRYLRNVYKDLPEAAQSDFELQAIGWYDSSKGLVTEVFKTPRVVRFSASDHEVMPDQMK